MMQSDQSNLELDNKTGKNHEGKDANTPVRVLTASSIIGDDVESFQGEKLATVKDIMLNVHDGTIEYVIISSGGFLGIGDKLFAVPYSELNLNPDKKCFTISKDKEYLKNAPGFDQDHWPETNAQFDEANTYWNSQGLPVGNTVTTDYGFDGISGASGTRVGTTGILDPTDQSTFGSRSGF